MKRNESRAGQSLFEIMIGLAIGVVLIGAGTFAISAVLRSHTTLQKLQSASAFTQGYLAKLGALASADWSALASLAQGSSSPYFLIASGTALVPVSGSEGILDNDVIEGLTGRWGLDEVSGAASYDTAELGATGALYGNPTRAPSASCKIGTCLSFDGSDDYVDYGNPAALNFGNSSFTLSAWFNNTAPSGYDTIVGKGGFWATDEYQIYTLSGNVYFYVDRGGTKYFTSHPVVANRWYHIAGTYDGSYIKLYVDGVFITQTPVSSLSVSNGSSFRVGKASSDPFAGYIDDVRVYNRALSAGEVQRLYAASPFTRSFYLETACRTTDASGTLSGAAPCSGGTAADPSAVKATVTVAWPIGTSGGSSAATTYLIRGGNETFRQTDWSGGSGETIPVTTPGSRFASSTNTDITGGGSVRIHGL